jgi:hypothetical protein
MTTSGTLELGDVAEVVLGVDTHLDFHVAVVLDHLRPGAWASYRYQRPPGVTATSSFGHKGSGP